MNTKNPYFSFLVYVLCLIPIPFLGFDFTDLGWHISAQTQAISQGFSHLIYNPYWGGSDILGSFWIQLVGNHLWAIRFSAIFIFASSYWLIQKELPKEEDRHVLLPLALISSAPMTVGMVFMAEYYTLPTLFLTFWSLCWLRLTQNQKSNLTLSVFFFLTVVLTFLRLPLVILFFTPILVIFEKEKRPLLFKWIILFILTLVVAYYSGIIELISNGIRTTKETHEAFNSFEKFVRIFKRDLIAHLIFGLEVTFLSYAIARIFKISFQKTIITMMIILFAIGSLHPLGFSENIPLINGIAKSGYKRSTICMQMIMFVFCCTKLFHNKKMIPAFLPIIILPWILIAGTNTGLLKINYLILLSFLIFSKFFTVRLSKPIWVLFFIAAFARNYSYFYRDGSILTFKAEPIKKGKLELIFTSEKTQNKLNELNQFLTQNKLQGQMIITYPELASIYYLNDSKMYLDYPWTHLLKKNWLFDSVTKDCKAGRLKGAIIQNSVYASEELIQLIKANCPVKDLIKYKDLNFISMTF